MKAYTRTGDGGETSLASGERVGKDCLRVAAYGSVDELNSLVGAARASCSNPEIEEALHAVQKELFTLGADLASGITHNNAQRIKQRNVDALEERTDRLQENLPELKQFILPSGTQLAAALHACRAVCRRAERDAVQLSRSETVNPLALAYLNRLGSFLFAAAREANRTAGVAEEAWAPE